MHAVSGQCGTSQLSFLELYHIDEVHHRPKTRDKLRTVDFFKHREHPLNIIVVEEPCLWVTFVLFKGDPERVGDVDCLAEILPKQYAYDTL